MRVVTCRPKEDKRLKRRDVLIGLGLVGIAAAWQVWGVRRPDLRFRDITGAPGWHIGQAGAVSGLSGADFATVGLERGPEPLPVDQLERVVHQSDGTGARLAVFGDFFCPYCRALMRQVAGLQGVPVTWHELPLLGDASVRVARVAEAANLQGGYLAFYNELMQSGYRPSETYLVRVAAAAGLDSERLLSDLAGGEADRRLLKSARAAARLGLYATPAIVVEQTAVLGAIPRDQIIELLNQVGSA